MVLFQYITSAGGAGRGVVDSDPFHIVFEFDLENYSFFHFPVACDFCYWFSPYIGLLPASCSKKNKRISLQQQNNAFQYYVNTYIECLY
jgi:hypothetical protein